MTERERRGETESGQEQRLTGLPPPPPPNHTDTPQQESSTPPQPQPVPDIMVAVQNNYELIYT